MIPGSNIWAQAMSVIASQSAQYYAFASRSVNAIGYDVASYAAPVTIRCSIQPIARNLYEHMGLDMAKSYINVFTDASVAGVSRSVSGDKIVFGGTEYQCISTTPWTAIDGWTEILCVAVT